MAPTQEVSVGVGTRWYLTQACVFDARMCPVYFVSAGPVRYTGECPERA